jgi:hypothetical protein
MWQELMHTLKSCHKMYASFDVDYQDRVAHEETYEEDFQTMVA